MKQSAKQLLRSNGGFPVLLDSTITSVEASLKDHKKRFNSVSREVKKQYGNLEAGRVKDVSLWQASIDIMENSLDELSNNIAIFEKSLKKD